MNQQDKPSDLSGLYRQAILSHAVNPVGHAVEIKATHGAEGHNPLCGDQLWMALQVEDGVIRAAAFSGEACAICMASASLFCKHVPGLDVTAIELALNGFTHALNENAVRDEGPSCPEYLVPMLGVSAFPARIACAVLPWEAAVEALEGVI